MNTFFCTMIVACFTYQVQDQKVARNANALTCPCNWEEFDGRCYYISNEAATWLTARQNCISQGGDLAVPTNSETNEFIFSAMKAHNSGSCYIGLFRVGDDLQRNTFYTTYGYEPSYTNWRSGEPNNSGGNEDCTVLSIGSDGKWNDVRCWNSLHFVCQASVQR